METREKFIDFLELYMLGRNKFAGHAQQAAGRSVPDDVRAKIDLLWDDMLNETYRLIDAAKEGTR